MEKLRHALAFGGILTEEQIELSLRAYRELHLEAGDHFQSIGQVAREIGFLDTGILRVFFIDPQGNEVTKYFLRPNQFAVDLDSYYSQQPGETTLQAIVPTRMYAISQSAWMRLSESIPNLFLLMKSLAEAMLLSKIKDNDFLTFGSATDKYREFLRRYPEVALQAPQQYIASYLQITPQSLSRIRRQLTGSQRSDQ